MMRVFQGLSDWYYANEKLDKAIQEDNIVLAKEALSEGAKLHGAYYNVNTFEHTPLCDAAKRGNRAMVELFLDRGADPNRDNRHGTTPLWKASKGGHLDVVRLLLDRGANIFAKSVCASKVFVPEYDFNDGRASMPVGRNSYETALSASSGLAKVTKPKPRLRPVSRSVITFASVTSPCCSKAIRRPLSSVFQLRPPTNNFLDISLS